MENINSESRKFKDFDAIIAEVSRRRAEEKKEFEENAAYKNYLETKKTQDATYSIGEYDNEVREEYFEETAKAIGTFRNEYLGLNNGTNRLSDYKARRDALKSSGTDEAEAEYLDACIEYMEGIVDAYDAVNECINGSGMSAGNFKKARTMLDKCLVSLDSIMSYTQSAAEEKKKNGLHLRESYAMIAALSSHFDMLQGTLVTPDLSIKRMKIEENDNGELVQVEDSSVTADGVPIHIVDGLKNPPAIKFSAKKEAVFSNDPNISRIYVDRSDEPLFDGLPSVDDIEQGMLGNCYMLASLTAIVRQNPAAILNCMRENDDNTVTVRFFNEKKEPVYVTVDKTVPMLENTAKNVKADPYSRGALWVKILEKAYVQSGLHVGKLKEAEEGTLQTAYTDIASGATSEFLPGILGVPEAETTGETITLMKSFEMSPLVGMDIYTFDQCKRFNMMKKACELDMMVTSGTIEKDSFDAKFDTKKEKDRGIVSGHAYTVVGTEGDPLMEKSYVILRNPHKSSGTTLDDKMTPTDDAEGYVKLELREFDERFGLTHIFDLNVSPQNKERAAEMNEMRMMYGRTLSDMNKALRDTDSFWLRHFKNSDKFNDFRKAVIKVSAAMNNKYSEPGEVRKSMEDLFKKASEYEKHCKTKDLNDKSSFRDLERQKMAKIIGEIEKEFGVVRKDTTLAELGDRTGISTSGYDKVRDIRAEAEKTVSGMANLKPEERKNIYAEVKQFIDDGGYQKLGIKKLAKMSKEEKFDFFRNSSNARRVRALSMVVNHADELIESMKKDGINLPNFEKELRFKSSKLAEVSKCFDMMVDRDRFMVSGQLPDASMKSVNALAEKVAKAFDSIKEFDADKAAKGLEAAVKRQEAKAAAQLENKQQTMNI